MARDREPAISQRGEEARTAIEIKSEDLARVGDIGTLDDGTASTWTGATSRTGSGSRSTLDLVENCR